MLAECPQWVESGHSGETYFSLFGTNVEKANAVFRRKAVNGFKGDLGL